jgi:FkbM family methyltransferase
MRESYSQFGEDIFLQKFFNKKKGFFIDIGCHHPFRYNNTYKLYKLGWRGLNIDLNKISIDLFNFMRPKDINLCLAISDKAGPIKYYIPNKNLISPEITIDLKFSKKYKKLHGNIYESHNTKSVTWRYLEKNYSKNLKKKVDLLKIDVEGADFKILRSINIKKHKPKLIMVEAPNFEKLLRKQIISYLKKNRYEIIYDNNLNIIFKKI